MLPCARILPSLGLSLHNFQVRSDGGLLHTRKEVNADALIHILACPQSVLILEVMCLGR